MSRSLVTVGSPLAKLPVRTVAQASGYCAGHDGPRHCQRRGAASALRRCVDLATRVGIDNLPVRCGAPACPASLINDDCAVECL